jgi:hypothetical protein
VLLGLWFAGTLTFFVTNVIKLMVGCVFLFPGSRTKAKRPQR